jgi:hypothetical protein
MLGLISHLSNPGKKVLIGRFGLDGTGPKTYGQLAEKLNESSSPQEILEYAESVKEADGKLRFEENDIRKIETELLREIRKPPLQK